MNVHSCFFYDFRNKDLEQSEQLIQTTKLNQTKENNKKYIYKFVSKDFFIENELFISNGISQMINYKKYFYIPSKIEKINYVNMNDDINEDESEDFETEYDINLKYRKKISSNNILLKYENIFLIPLKNYSCSSSKYFFYQLTNIYLRLLNSINMLNENHIFFNNLNDENIFINSHDFPVISNFLFSIQINLHKINENISHENILRKYILEYDPDYIQWPIEIHTIAYIFHHKLTSLSNGNIISIVNDLMNDNYILNNFSENIKQKYYNDGISFLNTFVNKNVNEIVTKIISHFKTWDNYALSIMYLQMIIKIHKSIKNNKFIIDFMKLLLKNISFHPEKRLSLKNTKKYFCEMLNNISKNEYKEIVSIMQHP